MKLYVLYFVCFLSTAYCQNRASYKFCTYPSDHLKCADLDKGGSSVQCTKVQDSVDCALKIKKGEADFGTFYPEQAHLVSRFLEEETAVVGELRVAERQSSNNSFQFVVVVKNGYSGGVQGLRGKNMCHPGFKDRELWTPRVRKELEYELFKDEPIKCSATGNRICRESEIARLDQFFGDSCRPGPWVEENPKLDDELQKKYPKLCKLCATPRTCSYKNTDLEHNINSCLIEQDADFMYTTIGSVVKHYNETQRSTFHLLCKDGSLEPISQNISDHCSWRNQPWTLIIARREKADGLQNGLKTWVPSELMAANERNTFASGSGKSETWMKTLQGILTRNEADRLQIYYNKLSPSNFLEQKNQKLTLSSLTDANMKWCTVSEGEQNKCEWLRQASRIAGIEPEMVCVLGRNVYDCLNQIKQNAADVMSIDSRLGYLARKKNLQNLLFNDKSNSDVSSIIALLPKNTELTNFEDLKGKKACFPEYHGLSWISFLEAARKRNIIPNTCDFGKIVSEFFSEACAPGAASAYHNRTAGTDVSKLCALCIDNCHANDTNKYYKDAGALQCLKDNNADVAFLEKQALDSMKTVDLNNFKILCKDGSVKEFNQIEDFEACALSETVDSEVIARRSDPRAADYKMALLHMEQLFGTAFKNEKTMEMFKQFNGMDDLMFKNTVLGFEDVASQNNYVQNYKDLFKNVDDCFKPPKVVTTTTTTETPTDATTDDIASDDDEPGSAWTSTASIAALLVCICCTLFFT